MFRAVFLAWLVAMSLFASECDISLGDLDQFVISWVVTVRNGGTVPAAVTVTVADKTRSVTLAPGAEVEVRSFKSGTWHVSIQAASNRKALLMERYQKLSRELDAMTSQNSGAFGELEDDVDDLEQALKFATEGPETGNCYGRMEDPGGDELVVVATQDNSRPTDTSWNCGR